MRDVKERRDKKRKIPLCARSEVVKIKYPRTCRIHICADIICCAFTEFSERQAHNPNIPSEAAEGHQFDPDRGHSPF
jgi:hypothetical protein